MRFRPTILLLCALLCGCAGRGAIVPVAPGPDPAGLETSLLLIGDAGAAQAHDGVLSALESEVRSHPELTTVVFLGDNIYPHGMPNQESSGRADAERRLLGQVTAAERAAAVYFIPGNHDWAGGGDGGLKAVRREERFLRLDSIALLEPEAGCPGPQVVDPGPGLRLVLLDTEWWFQKDGRPGPESSCEPATPQGVGLQIESAIRSAGERHVVVAGHHPLVSYGPHGGRFGWTDHVFPLRALAGWAWVPLPLIGSAYPIARMAGVSREDESSSAYRAFRSALLAAFADEPPLIYVAGHEHGLEVHRGPGARYTLVSGGGSLPEIRPMHPRKDVMFAAATAGFMRVDAYRDGRVRLTVISVDAQGRSSTAWASWLD